MAPETDEVICGDRNFSGIDSTICATPKIRALCELDHFRLRKIEMLFGEDADCFFELFALGRSVFPSSPLLYFHRGCSSDLIYVDDRRALSKDGLQMFGHLWSRT